ncbi:hypothetical protein [Methylobacterium sp. NEAU K]|uniref:hypothetical protein n=1 Tax=Methylobacterium sp. NEAU K TaxID=3064946 RepID=UPI0027370891|nr:hypothetical protein [Methylobacterium sp. NEAU K]MDP4004789.1 hypothetical protein [Methylobacterium sp. NEAU K]
MTPIIAMAYALAARVEDFAWHSCAYNGVTAPFLVELEAGSFGNSLQMHLSGEENGRVSIPSCAGSRTQLHPHLCLREHAPAGRRCGAADLSGGMAHLHRKRFKADVDRWGDAFHITTARSGILVEITPERSVCQVRAKHGVEIEVSYEQRLCGTCVTCSLDGVVDHRDLFLSEVDKSRGHHHDMLFYWSSSACESELRHQ